MYNPWLNISSDDYENHMREVGQLPILSQEFKIALEEFHPKTIAVIGAATGNGFQFINSKTTRAVHAIDINPDYLNILRSRYQGSIPGLRTHICNIDKETPSISGMDLIFAALVFEYTDIGKSMGNVSHLLSNGGRMVSIIQSSSPSHFVTKSSYTSLNLLSDYSNEIEIDKFMDIALKNNLELINQTMINVSPEKKFEKLIFRKIK